MRIELDEWPQASSLVCIPDYSARQVMSAAFSPLFRVDDNGDVSGSEIVDEVEYRQSNREVRILLNKDAAWSDGKKISNRDVAHTLIAAANSEHWNNHLMGIRRLEMLGEHELIVSLKWGGDHFSRLMSSVELSPSRPGCRINCGPFSGPYILSYASSEIHGTPNQYSSCNPEEKITFVINPDPEDSLAMYRSGQLDVTCNTGVSMFDFEQIKLHPNYHCQATGIYMQIEFANNSQDWLRDPEARHFLSATIARQELYQLLLEAFPTTDEFENTSTPTSHRSAPNKPRGCLPLTLSFHPYPPNQIVAEFIASCWEQFGIQTRLVCTEFGQPDRKSDLHLRLRFASYPHWYSTAAHYVAQLCQLHPDLLATIPTICEEALESDERTCPAKLSGVLYDYMPVLPLLKIDGHWLQRSRVHGYSVTGNASFDFSSLSSGDRS